MFKMIGALILSVSLLLSIPQTIFAKKPSVSNSAPKQISQEKKIFTMILLESLPYKISVTECIAVRGKMSDCNAGQNNIPPAIDKPIQNIKSLTVQNGVITITPIEGNGIKSEHILVITPKIEKDHSIVWTHSGAAVKAGFVK